MPITRLDHVQLAMPSGEEPKARDFFIRLIGMTEESKPEPLAARGGCWFRSGNAILHLGVEKEFAPQRKAHPAFCVNEIESLAKRLQHSGYDVIWDESLPSRKRFYTADPFGNRIEFMREGDGFCPK